MFISVCTFKRTRRSNLEYGIAVGGDESDIQTIVDANGDRVSMVSDYTVRPAQGCFTVELPKGEVQPKVAQSAKETGNATVPSQDA